MRLDLYMLYFCKILDFLEFFMKEINFLLLLEEIFNLAFFHRIKFNFLIQRNNIIQFVCRIYC